MPKPLNEITLKEKLNDEVLDGRTAVARLVKELRRQLESYVGTNTIASDILVQRIIFKHLRLTEYENTYFDGKDNKKDENYLSYANSLRSDIMLLSSMRSGDKTPLDLRTYLKKYKKPVQQEEREAKADD